MRKHRLGKLLLIVLCVSLLVFLAGCRPSPVLEQIIYEQNHEINEDLETKSIDNDPENEEPDEDIPSRETVDDAEQEKDQEYTSALAGDTDTESEEADAVYDVAYTPYGDLSEPDEANPTEGSASDEAVGSGGAAPDTGSSVDTGAGQETGTEELSGSEPAGGGNAESEEGDKDGTGNAPSFEPTDESRQVVDAAGRYVELPQNVDTVTAVGEIATMVEMLGGSGRLVGSSGSFTGSDRIRTTFDLTGVNTWWSDDGSSPCASFDALLAARPDACFEIDNQETFSSAQLTTLEEAGIAYVVLPSLNSIENIEYAVTIVGQVLGGDAERVASEYCSWADNMIRQASGGSAKYTVYISRWDDEAYWEIYSPSVRPLKDGYGAPVGMRSLYSSPLDECMKDANLTNRAGDNLYVDPVQTLQWVSSISGGTGKPAGNQPSFGQNYRLGVENFPAVIVADSTIAQNMLSGDFYEYHWRVGDEVRTSDNTVAYGFNVEGDGGEPIRTYIAGNYWIYVNPTGVGSWTDGSVESPLEAAWLSCKFQGGISENEMQSMVSDFYSGFYHTTANVPNVSEGYYITR